MKEKYMDFKEPEKLWNPMFIGVFISSALFNLSGMISDSLLSLYAKSTGASPDQIGSLISLFALTALIFRFIAGPAMNAYNRKRLLQLAMILFGTAYLCYSISPFLASLTGINVISIMKVFRLLQGIGNAFGNACMLTIVSECIPKDKFSSGMGIFTLAQVMSQALGPRIGIMIRDLVGYNTTYLITCGMMALSAMLVEVLIKVPDRSTGKLVLSLDNMIAKEAILPSVITFFVHMGFMAINSFFLVYAEERGIPGASYYFTVNAFCLMASRMLVGRLNDKKGFVFIAIPGLLMSALALVLIGHASKLWHVLIIAVINSLGYGAVQPSLSGLTMKCVPPERRGSASSTNCIAQDSATLLGPAICGAVAERLGYVPTMWTIMALPVLFGVVLVIIFRKQLTEIERSFITE